MTSRRGPIVVAVRQNEEAAPAVRFALGEAQSRGCGIQLVHVVHPYPMNAEELAVGGGLVGPAQEMLAAMAADVENRAGGLVQVTISVRVGPVAPTLVNSAQRACLLVLGERDHTRTRWTGSVRLGVSGSSDVPVVCVPSSWPGRRTRDGVAVGVAEPTNVGPALHAAIEMARHRGTSVRIVHAVWYAEPLDDAGLTPERIDEFIRLAESELQHTLVGLEPEMRDVPAEVHVAHGPPADVLARASEAAELLVLGRPGRTHHVGRHLGRVVRSVLQRSSCPVVLAGEPVTRTSLDRADGTRDEHGADTGTAVT